MSCKQVYLSALKRLGYSDDGVINASEIIEKNIVSVVNEIYMELFYKQNDEGFNPINTIHDEIELDEKIIFMCLIPGVCEKIAFDYGDANLQSYYASIYNQNLSLFNKQSSIKDMLPSDYMN
ncbi:MAG: hypothetical protein ACI39F_05695 [Acutalibacteraceae bacterium]